MEQIAVLSFPTICFASLTAIPSHMQGELKPDGLPVGVDYMIPLFYNILDESASTLFDDNLALTNFTQPDDTYDYEEYAAWLPTTQWHTINGYSW